MRKHFPAYYRIDKEKLLDDFDKIIFMFDASSLLDVFSLNSQSANEIIKVIEEYKNQIKIPYQSAKEYNKNIHKVLNDQLNNIQNAEKQFCKFNDFLNEKRHHPYITESTSNILKQLQQQIKQDFEIQKKYIHDQLIFGQLMNKMADILDDRVLDSLSEEELSRIEIEGKKRYDENTPPGYKDKDKTENKFGDLIIWKEILQYAKNNDNHIILITNDIKDDWIIRELGTIISPLYELLEEFFKESNRFNNIFHIYTLDQFLYFISKKNESIISNATIDNVRNVVIDSNNTSYTISKDNKSEPEIELTNTSDLEGSEHKKSFIEENDELKESK